VGDEKHPHNDLRMLSFREYIGKEEMSEPDRCEPAGAAESGLIRVPSEAAVRECSNWGVRFNGATPAVKEQQWNENILNWL
jgi:hypothetical protein